jgi:hypothetical protein
MLKGSSSCKRELLKLIKGCGYRDSCREHFRDINILPLRSHYIYSLMMFVIKKIEKYLIQIGIAMKLILEKI